MSRLDGARSTISMWHEGDYSTHTRGAKDAIDNARDIACEAVAAMDLEGSGEPFRIADYGAAMIAGVGVIAVILWVREPLEEWVREWLRLQG